MKVLGDHLVPGPRGHLCGLFHDSPEYEQFAAFGPVIGNTDVTEAIVLANECDRLGLENNELGWLVGMLMECYEKGILSRAQLDGLDLRWGNTDAVRSLMYKIARREGISRARVTQVLGLLRLAPEIQEHVLSLPDSVRRSAITERRVAP